MSILILIVTIILIIDKALNGGVSPFESTLFLLISVTLIKLEFSMKKLNPKPKTPTDDIMQPPDDFNY